MTTAAADALRHALADAPDGLHVGRGTFDLLDVFDGRSAYLMGDSECQPEMRLIGLLLAAAPHLADALEDPCGEGPSWPEVNLRRAITEAAQAMEPSDEPTTGD